MKKVTFNNLHNRRLAKGIGKLLYSVGRLAFLVCVAYIVIYPLLYMLVSSVKTIDAFQTSGKVWIPSEITFEHYKFIIEAIKFGKSLFATLKYELVSAVLEICSCAIVAYGFARYNFPFKKFLNGILFVTILVPSAMLIIPQSLNYSHMDFLGIFGLLNKLIGVDLRPNLIDTAWAFYLPSLLASGLRSGIMIFIYIQFFKDLPGELEEAAWVDGAGPVKTFIKIIIPSSTVVILTVSVFSIVWHWNDYQTALMFLSEDYPLSLELVNLPTTLSLYGYWLSTFQPATVAYLMCGCFLFILPPLIFYMIVQKWFIESIDRVGITG